MEKKFDECPPWVMEELEEKLRNKLTNKNSHEIGGYMEKTITKECPVCERVIAVSFDEIDEAEATERIEVYFANHVLNCGR